MTQKEVIRSDGRTHYLEGELIVEVIREIDEEDILNDSYSYKKARLDSGNLVETLAYNQSELCVQCRKRPGSYHNFSGEPICEECMKVDSYGDICTHCGRKVPSEFMTSENCCVECAEQYDF